MIAAFIYFKLLNRDGNLGFQDFIIDKISGKQPIKKSSVSTSVAPEPISTYKEEKPHTDVLANIVSEPQPLSIPDTKTIVSPEENYIAPTESTIPDWLKESTSLQSSPTIEATTQAENIFIPSGEYNKNETEDNPISTTENITTSISETSIDISSESGIPDWLK